MSLVLGNIGKAFGEAALIDDGIDRFHRKFMVSFLAVVCVVLGGKQFVGDPIECFLTSDISSQSEYINAYCWTSSTYQILPDAKDPYNPFKHSPGDKGNGDTVGDFGKGQKKFVSYYQWIPIVLCIQSLSFYIPYLIWRNLAKTSGLHLPNLMKGIYELAKVQTNDSARGYLLKDAVGIINQFLKSKSSSKWFLFRNLLVINFIIGKCVYLMNVFFQLWALHSFFQTNILAHSFNIVKKFIFEQDWTSSPRFPIRTLCQFNAIPQMHNYLTTHTTHCVLPINLYNDKIYAVIALLMLLLTILSVVGIVVWLFKLFLPMSREKLIRNRLQAQRLNPQQTSMANEFMSSYVGYDGRFILYLIDGNISSIVCECVIDSLWEKYKEEHSVESSEGSIHSEVDLGADAEEKRRLYPMEDIKKLAPLRCPNCQTSLPGSKEGAFCAKCGQVVDY